MSDDTKRDQAPDQKTEFASKTVNFSNIDLSHSQHARFYANHVAVQVTFFDFRLLLSTVHVENGTLIADETLNVLLSPEMAKVLKDVLENSLQQFTALYGPLRAVAQPPSPSEP